MQYRRLVRFFGPSDGVVGEQARHEFEAGVELGRRFAGADVDRELLASAQLRRAIVKRLCRVCLSRHVHAPHRDIDVLLDEGAVRRTAGGLEIGQQIADCSDRLVGPLIGDPVNGDDGDAFHVQSASSSRRDRSGSIDNATRLTTALSDTYTATAVDDR